MSRQIYDLKEYEIIQLLNIAHISKNKTNIRVGHGIGNVFVKYLVDDISYCMDISPFGDIEIFREPDNTDYLKKVMNIMLSQRE